MKGGGAGAEEGEEFGYFNEASWPWERPLKSMCMRLGTWNGLLTAMAEQERDSFSDRALLMHKMYVQRLKAVDLDRGLEVG